MRYHLIRRQNHLSGISATTIETWLEVLWQLKDLKHDRAQGKDMIAHLSLCFSSKSWEKLSCGKSLAAPKAIGVVLTWFSGSIDRHFVHMFEIINNCKRLTRISSVDLSQFQGCLWSGIIAIRFVDTSSHENVSRSSAIISTTPEHALTIQRQCLLFTLINHLMKLIWYF